MLRVLEEPDMVDDTRTVGLDLIEKDGVFSVAVDEKGLPQMQDLKQISSVPTFLRGEEADLTKNLPPHLAVAA